MTWNPLKLRRMVAIGGALLMAGCGSVADGPQELYVRRQTPRTFIIRDQVTGCEYIRTADMVIPRMQANGQQRCVR